MDQRELFLLSDASLRDVINRIRPEQLDLPVPAEWTRVADPALRDIVAAHVFDEAWVPDMLAGRTIDEVGDAHDGDLVGDDPIAAYNVTNDAATVAAGPDVDPDAAAHLSYGEYTVAQYYEHISVYRAFQAWSIAKFLGEEYSLPDALVEGLFEFIVPQAEDWRAMGVFGPAVPVPAGADRETELLCITGYWRE